MQRALLAEAGRRNLWWFFLYAFGARDHCRKNPRDNWVWPPLHRLLCYWLQQHILTWEARSRTGAREPTKLLVDMFRGGGKSTIGCATDLWIQSRDPNLSEVISSYDDDKAKEFLAVNRVVMEGSAGHGWFKDLYGVWAPTTEERLWQSEKLTHTMRTNPALRDPSFRTASVKRDITGGRPDIYRLDDPISKSKLTIDPNWPSKARESLDSAKWAVKTNGLYLVFLTPYLERDVADKILTEEGVASITAPARPLGKERYKRGGEWHVFFCPVRDSKGQSMMPNIYPTERLEAMERDDPDDFAAQMMCEPAAGSHMPLRMADTESLWVEREAVPRHWPVSVHLDTAFKDPRKQEKGCASVIQLWAHDRTSGMVYYCDGWRSQRWTGHEFTAQLILLLQQLQQEKRWPFIVTDDAPMSGHGRLFSEFLVGACRQVGLPAPNYIPLPRSATLKEARILQAVYGWKAGKVRLVRGAGEVQQLVYEMTHIGYAHAKDMADAAADVFHPDVYLPDPGAPSGEAPPPVRHPYDEELWSVPGIRAIYDAGAEEEEEGRAKWHEQGALVE